MAGSRIPLISTPIIRDDDEGKVQIDPLWFRWLQQVDQVIATLPPPVVPPPPPAQANILFQLAGVALGTANPPFVNFGFAANGSRVGAVVEVDYSHVPVFDISGTPDATWIGRCGRMSAAVNLPFGVFTGGDIFTLYNNTAGALNITASGGVTLRLGGSASTGTRSAAQRGMVTIYFHAANDGVAVGNVV